MEDKHVGLVLAILSSFLIGTSFVLTKLGLIDAARNSMGGLCHQPRLIYLIFAFFHASLCLVSATDGHRYLNNVLWWVGMATSMFKAY